MAGRTSSLLTALTLGVATAAAAAPGGAGTQTHAAGASETASRPNVIMILADDLGYADTSLYGGTIDTPNIEALASAGVTFTNGYAAAPVCSPSRFGLMTGQSAPSWGGNSNVLSRRQPADLTDPAGPGPTIAMLLHDAGYSTMAVGKWDLSGVTTGDTEETVQDNPNLPHTVGFDEYYGILAGIGRYCPQDDNETYRWDSSSGRYVSDDPDQYLTDEFSERAAEFVADQAGKDDPFFLYLAYNAPHAPLQTRTECSTPPPESERRARYEEMVRILDEGVGTVLGALDAADGIVGNPATDPNVQNTIVVFMSDNGPEHEWQTGDLREGKYTAFEGGVRVPFAMRWPARIPAHRTYDGMVSALDLLPTFATAAGVDWSNGNREGMDLVPPVLSGGVAHDTLWWRYYSDAAKRAPLGTARLAVRSGDLKYLRDVTPTGEASEYVFDLGRDYDGDGRADGFTEQHNEIGNPHYASDRQRLMHSWQRWAAAFPLHEPFDVVRAATHLPDGFAAYGGTWSPTEDARLQVVTDGKARAMAAATYFLDATTEADVQLNDEHGTAGLVTHGTTGPAGKPGQMQLNGYVTELVAGSDRVRLSRVDDGASQVAAEGQLTAPVQVGSTYRLRIVNAGNTIDVYVDGMRVLSWKDPKPWEGGNVGLFATTSATFDDLSVQPF